MTGLVFSWHMLCSRSLNIYHLVRFAGLRMPLNIKAISYRRFDVVIIQWVKKNKINDTEHFGTPDTTEHSLSIRIC